MMEQTKAEAAAYAKEIELLTRAMNHVAELVGAEEEYDELKRRLRVLLHIEEAK
jgi:hypothetical protein